MSVKTYSEVLDVERQHCSVRHFRDEGIQPVLLTELLETAQHAASSSFIQAYSIVRVTDPQSRKTIADAAGGQQWVIDAPEFFVLCADLVRANHACKLHGLGELEGHAEHMIVATVDVSLFAQNLLLAAESVGLGGVFIGGIRNDPQCIIDTLGLPKRVFPLFGLCLGWPSEPCQPKPRLPLEAILHTDRYDEGIIDHELEEYDKLMADYYRTRNSNQKQSNWSEQTAMALQKKKREHMLAAFQQQGFLLK